LLFDLATIAYIVATSFVPHTRLIGAIDLVGGLSLGLYRRLTEARRRLARRYPEENAGFSAVCATK